MALSTSTQTIPDASLPMRPPEECRILVVDDDERIVEIFKYMLQRDGYQVITASDGFAALTLIEREQPDVAVLDVVLPGVDGIEICRRIKNTPATQFLPVILVTAMSARASRHAGLSAGADDFLGKPPDTVELTVRVRSLLRTKFLHDELEAHRRQLEQRVAERTQELRAAYERLQELSRVKGNVLSIVSHELRTPLHQARLALDLARQKDLDEAHRATLLVEALDLFSLLEYRIGDIQAFSDPTDITLSPVSTRDLLLAAIEQVRILRRGRQDVIEVDIPKGLPPISASAHSLTRALAHIILNAVKFGGGKPVQISTSVSDKMVDIVIEDQGEGIKPEIIPHLFEPLEQGDASATRRHGGLGIGLALVKMILDAHRADIDIESKEGVGTSVHLALPIADI